MTFKQNDKGSCISSGRRSSISCIVSSSMRGTLRGTCNIAWLSFLLFRFYEKFTFLLRVSSYKCTYISVCSTISQQNLAHILKIAWKQLTFMLAVFPESMKIFKGSQEARKLKVLSQKRLKWRYVKDIIKLVSYFPFSLFLVFYLQC